MSNQHKLLTRHQYQVGLAQTPFQNKHTKVTLCLTTQTLTLVARRKKLLN